MFKMTTILTLASLLIPSSMSSLFGVFPGHPAFAADDEQDLTCEHLQIGKASAQPQCYTSKQAEDARGHSNAFFSDLAEKVATFPPRQTLEQQVRDQEKRRKSGGDVSVFDMVVGE